jgi:hypothetical protein
MRYIKPEFWTDGKIVTLSFPARLLYIGMWNFAMCDKGHVEDDALRLKMQIFPADDVDIPALVDELIRSGRVVRLEAPSGATYLHVVRLPDHQKVDPRWTTRCPACKNADDLTEALPNSPKLPDTPPNSPQEGRGGEGIGEEGITTLSDRSATRTRKPRSSTQAPESFAEFWAAYPRKEARGRAVPAYVKALKKTTPERIAEGARRYRDDPNREAPFTALPASWLNDERWDDGPLPAKNGKSPDSWSLWDAAGAHR